MGASTGPASATLAALKIRVFPYPAKCLTPSAAQELREYSANLKLAYIDIKWVVVPDSFATAAYYLRNTSCLSTDSLLWEKEKMVLQNICGALIKINL